MYKQTQSSIKAIRRRIIDVLRKSDEDTILKTANFLRLEVPIMASIGIKMVFNVPLTRRRIENTLWKSDEETVLKIANLLGVRVVEFYEAVSGLEAWELARTFETSLPSPSEMKISEMEILLAEYYEQAVAPILVELSKECEQAGKEGRRAEKEPEGLSEALCKRDRLLEHLPGKFQVFAVEYNSHIGLTPMDGFSPRPFLTQQAARRHPQAKDKFLTTIYLNLVELREIFRKIDPSSLDSDEKTVFDSFKPKLGL